MSKVKKGEKKPEKKPKKLLQGDDAIDSFEADWLDFKTPAIALTKQLYTISKSSGVCCGIIGPWGCGKSSFMKLMDEYIQKESSWKNVHISWFTAWDPGGIQDLGDAMLCHFFRDIAGENQEMVDAFKELQEALGIRRSFKERARRVLEGVSGTLPTTGRAAAAVASSLLGELETPMKVQKSFDKLMNWLEKENKTVFFFIDDIDRATGDQIRDLLSELKLYISHRRIIAVLGYDDDYVLNALKPPVLPSGIDPQKYLEKIVTIRRNVPIAKKNDLSTYTENLINSLLDLPQEANVKRLSMLASALSRNNPRRLKNIVLRFTHLISSVGSDRYSFEYLASFLIICAAAHMGFLANSGVRNAFIKGLEVDMISAIKEFVNENPTLGDDAAIIINIINSIRPGFKIGSLEALRLHDRSGILDTEENHRISEKKGIAFEWNASLFPIVSTATMLGFKIPPEIVEFSSEIVIPPSTKTVNLSPNLEELPEITRSMLSHLERATLMSFILSWDKGDMIVLLSSSVRQTRRLGVPTRGLRIILNSFFSESSLFVVEKSFIIWIIDDLALLSEENIEIYIKRAREISKGLKHPFIFLCTPASKISSLLTFLLNLTNARED